LSSDIVSVSHTVFSPWFEGTLNALSLIRFIPKNQLSFILGRLAHARLPYSLHQSVIRWFIRRFGINVAEINGDIAKFRTLGEFFVRELRPEVRPIGSGVTSPADGKIIQQGLIQEGALLQVKGRAQGIQHLLRDSELANLYDGGYFVTFYLSPRDYHRVHSPVAGLITDSYYIPGKLWPVNTWSVANIANLYGVNERIVTVIESDFGRVAVIMIGATNVGSIRMSYDDLISNGIRRAFGRVKGEHRHYTAPHPIHRGGWLGSFHLGSSVILLFEPGRFRPGRRWVIGDVRFGETLFDDGSA
jgi:phosphatidylserine decarboxylase